MLNKNAIKVCFGVLSLSLLLSAPAANAWWPFPGSTGQEKISSARAKEIFEESKNKLESTKNNYKELNVQIGDAIPQVETSLNDFKNFRVPFEEQLGKVDAAYKEWAEKDFTLKGDSYEKFKAEKEQFDKFICMIRMKEDILKAFFNDLFDLIQKDSNTYDEYKGNMCGSVDSYYNYGKAVARSVALTV
jgi:hypothetical protein